MLNKLNTLNITGPSCIYCEPFAQKKKKKPNTYLAILKNNLNQDKIETGTENIDSFSSSALPSFDCNVDIRMM